MFRITRLRAAARGPPNIRRSLSNPPQILHSCDYCDRAFSTRIGVGVHMRKVHPDEVDKQRESDTKNVKMRWSNEEMSLLALKEAEFTRDGKRYMNILLMNLFPNRTVEAIKKVRQKIDYKALVLRFINARNGSDDTITRAATSINVFLEHITSYAYPENADLHLAELLSIARLARSVSKEETLCKVTGCLMDVLPCREQRLQLHSRDVACLSRRQARRTEYARTQRHFKQHQGRCIRSIIEGSSRTPIPEKDIMEPYWRVVMEQAVDISPIDEQLICNLSDIWAPITTDEITNNYPSFSSSPGPDGITSQDLRNTPSYTLMIMYNLIMWCQKCPASLLKARTIFLPKKCETMEPGPGDFRPITIPSICARHMHGIISRRINNKFCFDSRQRAFRHSNGCADNTTLLDMVLRHHHKKYLPCYIASLDVSKAFDSVSHRAIFGTLKSYGMPEGFVAYMEYIYGNSTTSLMGDDWVSSDIHPKRGVKQGDPLSPVLFNIIINRLLKLLPDEVGVSLGSANINAIAFADDIVLLASTPQGLQLLLDITQEYLYSCGMSMNRAKCFTVSIEASGKKKYTFVSERKFNIAGINIPSLKRSEEFCYLGVYFTPDGRSKFNPRNLLEPKLANLKKAPLKPQQRLHALKTILIPQLYHRLALGNVMVGCLRKTDAIIRAAVRNWLHLAKDVPNAFFYAPTSHGGLGIPSVRWIAPWLRMHCLENLEIPNSTVPVVANTFITTEINIAKRRLLVDGKFLLTKKEINSFWSEKLHASVDGAGLKEASNVPSAHRWVYEPSKLLSGRDYINCLKLRINALPSKSRTTRGRARLDRQCRGGCDVPETTNHILQGCHRTHGSRMDRHNCVVKFIKRSLDVKGWETTLEPHFRTSEGLKKPDMVAIKDNVAVVIDAQVVTDSYNTDELHQTKVRKYDGIELKNLIKERFRIPRVEVTSATLNWRGIWSKKSFTRLLDFGILNKNASALLSTQVVIGGIRSFRIFNHLTTTRANRQGIG